MIEFTQEYLERLLSLEDKIDNISTDLKDIKQDINTCTSDHETRIWNVEVYGSEKTKQLTGRVTTLEEDHAQLKNLVQYQQGKLYFIFLTIGAAVAAVVAWVVDKFT